MAIVVVTPTPNELIAAIRTSVNDGHIDTWEYDGDGDFTHVPPQWKYQAWLRPYAMNGLLHFGLVGLEGVMMTKEIYAIYHGRFIEMLLAHFDLSFTAVTSTALGAAPDNFKAAPVN